MFSRVFETAFSGCGRSFSEIQQSRSYRRQQNMLDELLRKHPANSALGSLLKLGPLRASALLNQYSFDEAVDQARQIEEDFEYNPSLFATMHCFSNVLLRSAQDCLPGRFIEPHDCWSRIGNKPRKELDLDKIARSWKSRTSKQRYEIGKMLMYLFRDQESRDSESLVNDNQDQDIDRVLPALYGQWDPEKKNRANCLGRAQLLAAFGLKADARMLSAVPVEDYWQLLLRKRSEVASKVLRFYAGAGLPLKDRSKKSLQAVKEQIDKRENGVRLHHMTLALQLRGSSWMLIDPNFHMRGYFDEDWQMNDIYELCERTSSSLPGFSCLRKHEATLSGFDGLIRQTDVACGQALSFARQISSAEYTKDEIVNALANSSFLDELLKLPEFAPFELPVSSSRRKKAICVLLEFLNKMEERSSKLRKKQDDAPSKPNRMLWFVVVKDWSEDRLFEEIGNDQDARQAIEATILGYVTNSLTEMDRASDVSFRGERIQHPVLEFAHSKWGMAAATLSHVGVAMDLSQYTVEAINSCALRQRELVYLAGNLLKENGQPSRLARTSVEILKNLSFHSCGATRVLDGLAMPATN